MSNDKILTALRAVFEKHRIVFWNDTKRELRAEYEALTLDGVEKIELNNNEYGVKYRVLREAPEQQFLLYREGPTPADIDNWLLDVALAHGEFRTDQTAIWLSELELGYEFSNITEQHSEFFAATSRRQALKKLLTNEDTHNQIRLKMLAVCVGSSPSLDAVLERLLSDAAEKDTSAFKLLERSHLTAFFWEQMERTFNYCSQTPSIEDFAITLFKSCYAMALNEAYELSNHALVFLSRWKDSRQHAAGFEYWSDECAQVLAIEEDLVHRDFRLLVQVDYFELIDRKIISELVRLVMQNTVPAEEVSDWVRERRQCHWYANFEHLYEAIDYGAEFVQLLSKANLSIQSFVQAVEVYSSTWFKLDQLYRKCIHHALASGQASLMSGFTEQIENLYTNNYLLKLGDAVQPHIAKLDKWNAYPIALQKDFCATWVQPYVRRGHRVCVIISDALRYEIGEEMLRVVRQEDRYNADIKPMLAMLPSYTQLGMAALLPHETLTLEENGYVTLDGQSTRGLDARNAILQAAFAGRGGALKAEQFMSMDRQQSREFLKNNDVIYLYHDRIDHTGDALASEGRAFQAAEDTLDDLLRLVKKLTAANANNILITADHGFIYQNKTLDESDFLGDTISKTGETSRSRRYRLGRGLEDYPGLQSFTTEQLGLAGDIEVQVPKSINRMRVSGSGSRFVHGGASLQEVVIPVLHINKGRQSDVSAVEVEIIRGGSSVITSGQHAVSLYQVAPVTDKVQPRHLRIGLYTQTGQLISDVHEITFDMESDNPRDREVNVRLVLSHEADNANNQEVVLKLEEKHGNTTHYVEYASQRYTLRRSFTTDFDF